MNHSKLLSLTVLTLLLMSGFACLLVVPEISPVGEASADVGPIDNVSVCIGDSITYSGVGIGYSYPDRLQAYIGQTVINKGVIGDTTTKMLARYADDVLAHSPGLIIIMGGTNDIAGTDVAIIESNLASMVSQGEASGANVILLTVPPSSLWGGATNTKLATLNTWIASQAASNVFVADVHEALKDPATPTQLLATYDSGDAIHPNAAGAKIIAESVASAGVSGGLWTINEWTASSAGSASVGASWSLGHAPATGECIVFEDSSINCNFDVTSEVRSIGLAVDYSGTLTIGANVALGAGGMVQYGGTLTGSVSYVISTAGPFISYAGTLTSDVLRLKALADGARVQWATSYLAVFGLEFAENTTFDAPNVISMYAPNAYVKVAAGKTVTMDHDLVYYHEDTKIWDNKGSIVGDGVIRVDVRFQYCGGFKPGSLSHLEVFLDAGSDSGMSLGEDSAIGTLLVQSLHATYVCTLDCNDFDLSVNGITVATRGVVQCGAGTISNAGDLTTTDGTWTPEASTYVQTGVGTIMQAAGQTFNNLRISANATFTSIYQATNLVVDEGYSMAVGSHDGNVYTSAVVDGQIAGTGSLTFCYDRNCALSGKGSINTPVVLYIAAYADSAALTLGSDFVFAKSVTLFSGHASNTITLDANGHDLSAGNIIVSTRGVLLGGEGNITTTTWDSSNAAAMWTPETSNVSVNGTVNLASGQTFYDLTVPAGATATQASTINVTHEFWLQGAWNKGAYALTLPAGYENRIVSTPADTVAEDHEYSYTPFALHAGTFTATSSASWLTWNGTALTGVPDNEDVGSHTISVTFSNGVSTIYQNATFNVTNTAPVFVQDPITEWSYGNTYLYDAQTDEEWHGVTYSFTATGTMDWWIEPDSGILRAHITDTASTDISILADDGNGGRAWLNYTVVVDMLPWDHEVIIGYEEGQNYRVTFDFQVNDSARGNVERVQWNFGDGNGSRDLNPSHQYDRPGVYLITCWVRMLDGTASAKSIEITVGDPVVVEEIDNRIAEQLKQAAMYVAVVAVVGILMMCAYARYAGARTRDDKLVLALIAAAVLVVSAVLIGGAMT